MPVGPDSDTTIYNRLVERITDEEKYPNTAIKRITNFLDGSFNQVWVLAFSEAIRENQIKATSTQLSGWIDYAGGPITDEDIRDLGLEGNVEPDEINEFINETDLDELVEILGVERNEGEQSSALMKVLTNEDRTIEVPQGTTFGTQPDSRGNFFAYRTDDDYTIPENPPDRDTPDNWDDPDDADATEPGDAGIDSQGRAFVLATADAEEIGEEYNVPAGTITFLVDPPTGVDSAINEQPAQGGANRETNDELRERAKDAVATSVGGGTTQGIIGRIINDAGASDVLVDEFFDGNNVNRPATTWPHVEVIVDGGDETEIEETLEDSRPTGVQHFLIRPETYVIDTEAHLTTDGDLDEDVVPDELLRFYGQVGIGEDLYRNKVIQTILNASDVIINIEQLDLFVADEPVTVEFNYEAYEFDENQLTYDVDGRLGRAGAVLIGDNEEPTQQDGLNQYEYGVDWEETSSGIEWIDSAESTHPNNGEMFTIGYIPHADREQTFSFTEDITSYELGLPVLEVTTVIDEVGNEYTEGVDWELVGNNIEWIAAGDSPDEGTNFTVDYIAELSRHRIRKPECCADIERSEVVAVIDGEEIPLNKDIHYEVLDDGVQALHGAGSTFEYESQEYTVVGSDAILISYRVEEDLNISVREKIQAGESTITSELV